MDTTKCIAALFDFDGVVMDTETQYTLFWNEIGEKYFPQYPEFGRIIKGQTLTRIMILTFLIWKKSGRRSQIL